MLSDYDPDRLSFLFDLAESAADAELPELSPEEAQALEQLRTLLDRIDAAWQAPPTQLERVRLRFLEQLATTDPRHPWVAASTVRTVGELIEAGSDEMPSLPGESLALLRKDATPVAALLDPAGRTSALGRILRAAGVPPNLLGELLIWFNRTLSALVALPNQEPGLLYTRRQSPRSARKGPPSPP